MNSLSFTFGMSFWIVGILLFLSVGITLFSYWNTIPPISKLLKSLLAVLRITGLFLLLFALVEPLFTLHKTIEKPPIIVVLFDNSMSMKENTNKIDTYTDYKNALKNSTVTSLKNTITYRFDEQLKRIENATIDSLNLLGKATNLSLPFQRLQQLNQSENSVGIVLFSDGNYTAGSNPIHDALLTNKPIYVVGIGDSVPAKDFAIASVLSNEVTFKNNATPVSVTYKINGFDQQLYKISLFEKGVLVSEKNLSSIKNVSQYSTIFDYTPKEAGLKKLTVSISPVDGEVSKSNNTQSILINVLDTKRKVTLFAGAPSPDVSFVTTVLSTDKSIELQAFVQKFGSEFYDPKPTLEQLSKSDILVFIGFPISSTQQGVLDMVKTQLVSGKPLLFVTSPMVDYKKLLEIAPNIPFTVKSSSPQEFLVTAHIPQETEMTTSLLRLNGNEDDKKLWNSLPPIYKTETFISLKSNAEVLSRTRVNSTVLNEPLIVASTGSMQKTIALLGYGIYRWKLLGNAEERSKGLESVDVLQQFLDNTVRWLSINDNKKQVKVRTSKKRYSQGEVITVEATVLDAQYQPIDNAFVESVINKTNKRVLNSIGSGMYRTTFEGMNVGEYTVVATASQSNTSLGSDYASFLVDSTSIEQQALPMNIELLRSLAIQSGGQFYTSETVHTVVADIQKRQTYRTKPIVEKEIIPLWKSLWLVLIALTCFSAEWILRKRNGLL